MIICVDFDGTIVRADRSYDAELELLPGAKAGLESLKRAGHTLILYSARLNPCLWQDWRLNSLWAQGLVPFDARSWQKNAKEHFNRRNDMLRFIERELPGVFALAYADAAKPVGVDLFIDDRAMRSLGDSGMNWDAISRTWGEVDNEG